MKPMKNKGMLLAVILSAGLLCACGNKKTASIDAGMAAVESHDYETALTSFEKAVVDGEDFELAYRGQGIAYMGMADYENAIASFQKALSEASMFPGKLEYDINFYMATAQYKMEDVTGAIETLDSIIDLQDEDQDAYFLRGSAWMKLDEVDKGESDLKKAIELSDSDTEMVIDVYEVLANYGYEEAGTAYLTELLDKHVKDMSEYEKGKTYFYLADYENARNSLETAKNEDKSNDPGIVLMLGQTYEQLGDSEYAAVLYNNYLSESDPNPEIYNQLGLCKLSAEDYQAALDAFQTGLKVEDNQLIQSLSYNEIVAYEHLGDFTTATSLMKKYLAAYPDDAAAAREYTFLQSR